MNLQQLEDILYTAFIPIPILTNIVEQNLNLNINILLHNFYAFVPIDAHDYYSLKVCKYNLTIIYRLLNQNDDINLDTLAIFNANDCRSIYSTSRINVVPELIPGNTIISPPINFDHIEKLMKKTIKKREYMDNLNNRKEQIYNILEQKISELSLINDIIDNVIILEKKDL
jgi:hypothetical protein